MPPVQVGGFDEGKRQRSLMTFVKFSSGLQENKTMLTNLLTLTNMLTSFRFRKTIIKASWILVIGFFTQVGTQNPRVLIFPKCPDSKIKDLALRHPHSLCLCQLYRC